MISVILKLRYGQLSIVFTNVQVLIILMNFMISFDQESMILEFHKSNQKNQKLQKKWFSVFNTLPFFAISYDKMHKKISFSNQFFKKTIFDSYIYQSWYDQIVTYKQVVKIRSIGNSIDKKESLNLIEVFSIIEQALKNGIMKLTIKFYDWKLGGLIIFNSMNKDEI